MSNKNFFNQWKTLKCDLCGIYDIYQNIAEITVEDMAGRAKLRVCQSCEEKIFDTLSVLCAGRDTNNEQ